MLHCLQMNDVTEPVEKRKREKEKKKIQFRRRSSSIFLRCLSPSAATCPTTSNKLQLHVDRADVIEQNTGARAIALSKGYGRFGELREIYDAMQYYATRRFALRKGSAER